MGAAASPALRDRPGLLTCPVSERQRRRRVRAGVAPLAPMPRLLLLDPTASRRAAGARVGASSTCTVIRLHNGTVRQDQRAAAVTSGSWIALAWCQQSSKMSSKMTSARVLPAPWLR